MHDEINQEDPNAAQSHLDPPKEIEKLHAALDACAQEKKEYLEGWQRAKADHINYKNDEARRTEDMARFVVAGLVNDLLPALDSFDLALNATHGLSPETEKGILLIRTQFEDVLRKRGIELIMVVPGEEFNPEKHETIGEMESEQPEGTIAEVVQKGYVFRGRVLRPARVRIVKSKINS